MPLEPWQWIVGLLGAFLMGVAKGGLPGIGNLTVAMYAMAFDARESVGILLPVLIAGDVVAVALYRRHAEWIYVRRLLPWMIVGVIAGYFALGHVDSATVRLMIGAILLSMTALHFFRKWRLRSSGGPDAVPHTLLFRSTTGVVGGFSTMVANAAGPVAALYFLAVGLPKLAFLGTGAWTFFILNVFKLPFQVELGLINRESLAASLAFVPAAIVGALLGPLVVRLINQQLFEALVWFFVVVAGVGLLFNIDMMGALVNLFVAR